MSDFVSGVLGGAGAGATATESPWGAVIGGAVGGLLGLGSDNATSRAKKRARRDLKSWQSEAERILAENHANQTRMTNEGDLKSYQDMRDSFDPSRFVYSSETDTDPNKVTFDKSNYNVEDFLNPNAQAIRRDIADTIQHTAAGSAMGHSSGAAQNIVHGVMEKDEQLLRDAREQMNQERNFDYGMYTDYIKNKQAQLDAIRQGTQAQMEALRGDIMFDQQQEDNYVTNRLNLGNSVAQTKAQLV